MLENLLPRAELKGFSRQQSRMDVWKTVKPAELDDLLRAGWHIRRKNKHSVALRRPKTKAAELESRVWTLLYRMGFQHLSGEGGARLSLQRQGQGPWQQLDVVAMDNEVAIAVECKTSANPKRDPGFTEKLTKLSSVRGNFSRAIHDMAPPTNGTRHIATIMFIWDIVLSQSDEARAKEEQIRVLDLQDLEYYEALTKHLGQAARYQLLAEVFKGKTVKGLELKVPALKTGAGKLVSYTFAVKPEYLLKIAYIAHRAKGKAFDVDAYQRMLSKTRLKAIAEFIAEDGIFPTNIVINIENRRHVRFDQSAQLGSDAGGTVGWLTLAPAYGSAWVIDGQHRLFAYSGHERADTSYLHVLAFEGLSPARQTELFVEINSEQRRVKRSLLVELDATLKWDDEDEDKRIHAIISKAAVALDQRAESPLHSRILMADVRRTKVRCVSLTAIAGALRKPGFFIKSRRAGQVTQYGPFWRDDATDALRRTVTVLIGWFEEVANKARDWWDLGSDEGGGLAMNDGVTVCVNVFRGVLEHLDTRGDLVFRDDEELVQRLQPYARALGDHFGRMTLDERQFFRRLRGVQGQTTGTMTAYESLTSAFPSFVPEGLADWIERRKLNTNEQARKVIDRIERAIQARILEDLKSEFRKDEDDWWFSGVPKAIRKKVDDRINEMDGGKREESFDLLHYEAIIHHQWDLFKDAFAYSDRPNVGKQRGTAWLRDVGDMRNKVMHPSRNDFLSVQELQQLEMYESWLKKQLADSG